LGLDMGKDREWNRLMALLRERSYQRRRVILTSGKESDFYIDGKLTSLAPNRWPNR
jgi:orotate phosphoribosyltransferase